MSSSITINYFSNMKHRFYFIFSFLLFSFYCNAQDKKDFDFVLDCNLKNDFSGYIYLMDQDMRIDSCLVVNNHFSFKGKLQKKVVAASIIMKDRPVSSGGLYLEDTKMKVDVSTRVEKMNDGSELTIFEFDKIEGSKTDEIQQDYKLFEKLHKSDNDFYKKSIQKLKDIVSQNPKNPYAGDLLSGFSRNENYDKEQLKKIYKKLDKENQSEFAIKFIEKNLFLIELLEIDDSVFNFELPDTNNKLFDTKSLAGKWLFIDFWASWCEPCRKQIPDLKKVYDNYKNKKFEVVSLSIDKNKKDWIKAINKENLNWINLNEDKGFYGLIVKRYNVYGIPSNFLINPQGKIVAKNISVEELENILEKNNL